MLGLYWNCVFFLHIIKIPNDNFVSNGLLKVFVMKKHGKSLLNPDNTFNIFKFIISRFLCRFKQVGEIGI